jgi:hypothetical protein
MGEAAAPASGVVSAPWRVTYHDGSANGYRIWQDTSGTPPRFEYTPIQPHESATGTYSGGEPRMGTLDDRQVTEIWRLIRAMEADAALHTESRDKGTGAFSLSDTSGGQREFIVIRGPQLLELDRFLGSLR